MCAARGGSCQTTRVAHTILFYECVGGGGGKGEAPDGGGRSPPKGQTTNSKECIYYIIEITKK